MAKYESVGASGGNGKGNDSGRRPWDVPKCPECGSRIYVDGFGAGSRDWHCHKCDVRWRDDNEDKDKLDRTMTPQNTAKRIQDHQGIQATAPRGPATRNYCNNCEVVFYSAPFSDFITCPVCESRNSIGQMKVINGK